MPTGRADQNLIKRLNSALILNHLLASSPQSRANLAQQTGLNRSTISSLVNDLIEQEFVRELGLDEARSRGRPGILLELNPHGGCIVGIEVNVGYITVILTDFKANTLWRRYIEVDEDIAQCDMLSLSEALIQEALDAGVAHGLRPLGIGLGVPGLVDRQRGMLTYSPVLSWRNVPFRDLWSSHFGIPLYIENDGSTAALGEYYFGVAKNRQDFLYLGTGIGLAGGLMLNGEIYRGAGGFAGEVGHMIVESGGELCGCGRRGCWETLVGPRAVTRGIRHALANGAPSLIPDLVNHNPDLITMHIVVNAANKGDQLALDTLSDIALNLGTGIANLINLFNPSMIVLGGNLTLAGDYLLPPISRIIASEALHEPASMVALALSVLGMDACVKGAIALVIDQIVREPIAHYTT
ncbi:MAG: ROK family transcriptional regulator [Anaerolineae bacterium]|nr:ROK family transcriptional regulator [Anaerolineae bacterium]